MKVLAFFDHDAGLYGVLPSQPSQVVTGGYRRFLEIAKRIKKYDVELDVVESSPTYPNSDPSLHYNCHEFVTPALRVANTRLTDPWLVAWKMARIGKKLAEKEHFDLILSPSESVEMCLAAFLTSHVTKIPWIAVVHHINLLKPNLATGSKSNSLMKYAVGSYSIVRHISNERLVYYLYNKASIISVSHATEQVLRNQGVTSNIFINGNGLDLRQINSIRSEKSLYDGIFVGRFVQSKGLPEALEIFEKICNKRAESKFALVGDGDPTIMRLLNEEIKKKKLEKNVDILGYVDEEKKFELMKSSKVFVYPSHVEGWGIVVGEALACGLPVVCYDLSPFKELFKCDAVRMCKEGNVDQMIVETGRLLQDSAGRNRLGLIGRSFARKFDWEEVAEREAEIYRRIT